MSIKPVLRTSTALIIVACASPVFAQTTVSTDTTTPLETSNDGDITITDAGSVSVGTGSAITVDSDNDVTIQGDGDEDDDETVVGEILGGDADGVIGIRVVAGSDTNINNAGDILITENFQPDDLDNDGQVDGSFASASDRYGIYVEAGAATSGSITNSGNITVEGNDSGGIVVDSAFNGSILNTGDISVVGDNGFGIRTQDVDGDVTIMGVVDVVGDSSIALATQGDISGALVLQGTISQSSSHETDDETTLQLARDSFRTGAPAVHVAGNVDGGIIVAVPPSDEDSNDDDEDNDGIPDSEEGRGVVSSVGNGPALLVGGATDTVIGTVAGVDGDFSLVNDGTISSNTVISATDSFALVIGGEGGNVDLTGGISSQGTISARTISGDATGILINAGSTVSRIENGGSLTSRVSTGGDSNVYGIRDLSGTLTSITNTGDIAATGTSDDLVRAISLENATQDVTITQLLSEEDAATKAANEAETGERDTTVYTSIVGDVRFGSGNDTFDIQAGRVTGDTFFNEGNDTLNLSGDGTYVGNVDFGTGGGAMSLSDFAIYTGVVNAGGLTMDVDIDDEAIFAGTFQDGANVTVNVDGGIFSARTTETTTIGTLNVADGGTYRAFIDSAEGESSLLIVDTANFEEGAQFSAIFSSLEDVEGTYTVITATNAINGLPVIAEDDNFLPFILNGTLVQNGLDVDLTVERKGVDELDLNLAASSAYEAFFETTLTDAALRNSLQAISNSAELQEQVDKFLPDHSGGVFDLVTQGSRISARHLRDRAWTYDISNVGAWIEPFFFNSEKDAGDTAAFDNSGWGITLGGERWSKLGYLGASYTYLDGTVDNNGGTGEVGVSQHELGLHWRMEDDSLLAFAQISGGYVSMDSTRVITGTEEGPALSETAGGDWNGWLYSGKGGISYDLPVGERLSFRPQIGLEYFRLDEDGYTEIATDEAVALDVDSRDSDVFNAEASLVLSYALGTARRDNTPMTIELEGGRRENLGGSLGSTTANFEDGDDFTITPEDLESNWFGEVRFLTGGKDFTFHVSGRGERRFDNFEYSIRASLSAAF